MIHFLESFGFFLSKSHFSKYEVRVNADLGIEIVGFYSKNVISSSEGTVDPIDSLATNLIVQKVSIVSLSELRGFAERIDSPAALTQYPRSFHTSCAIPYRFSLRTNSGF